jgi:hypothetical protein
VAELVAAMVVMVLIVVTLAIELWVLMTMLIFKVMKF